MKLNEKLAKKIIKAMFREYSFETSVTTPDDDLIYFQIEQNDSKLPQNNVISLFLEDRVIEFKIFCNTRSEDYKLLGIYDIKTGDFIADREFWPIMFMEHLQ